MLDVAFINTAIAKISFSPSKVTLNDILFLYPSLGRVCHPREAEVLPEVWGHGSPCVLHPSYHCSMQWHREALLAWKRVPLLWKQLVSGTDTALLRLSECLLLEEIPDAALQPMVLLGNAAHLYQLNLTGTYMSGSLGSGLRHLQTKLTANSLTFVRHWKDKVIEASNDGIWFTKVNGFFFVLRKQGCFQAARAALALPPNMHPDDSCVF